MVDTAIRRMTLAGREAHRSERGANRIPAVWRGTVVFIRDQDSASGARAGVYVRVPRLVGEQTLGPLPVVGTVPVVGDRVLVVAVEGRRDQLMILNPPAGVPDDLLDRLDAVETKADGLRSDLDAVETKADALRADVDALDQALQQVLPRLEDVEQATVGLAGDVSTLADDLTSKHGQNVNAIGVLESQMEVVEDELHPQWQTMTMSGPWEPAPDLAPPMWRIFGGHVELRGHVTSDERGELFRLPSDVSMTQVEDAYITVVNGGEVMSIRVTLQNDRIGLAWGILRGLDRLSANFSFNSPVPLAGVRLPL